MINIVLFGQICCLKEDSRFFICELKIIPVIQGNEIQGDHASKASDINVNSPPNTLLSFHGFVLTQKIRNLETSVTQ